MILERLLDGVTVEEVRGRLQVRIAAVTHDSRQVVPGALFCCVPGQLTDGHDHAPAAVDAGAVALLCERVIDLPGDVAQIVVADTRTAMGPVAAAFHQHPSDAMDVVGVTGTNGKTTTTLMLQAILEAAGRPTGVIGTLSGSRTTPEAPELQARLAQLRTEGRVAVAMEVSSHALDQHRVAGTRFRVAVFTNLSPDHLDYHPTMEDYFAAKARLFDASLSEQAVVNVDDPRGRLLRDAASIPTTGYSMSEVDDLTLGMRGSTGRWRGHALQVPLGGAFNVSNALAALTTASLLGVEDAVAVEGLAATPPVDGRFELVDAGQAFPVIVDYAHTPDGLEQVLGAARAQVAGRVLVVFGCGGERDREKRPAMGAVAARLADVVVVTSDNPRSEDPQAIIQAVVAGVRGADNVQVEPDREAAIALALHQAGPDDVVVVAGKGHETTQVIGDRVLAFDDREVARRILEASA